MADRPDEASRASGAAFEGRSQRSFQMQHYTHFWLQTHVDLYRGGAAACARVDAMWPTLRWAGAFIVQQTSLEVPTCAPAPSWPPPTAPSARPACAAPTGSRAASCASGRPGPTRSAY